MNSENPESSDPVAIFRGLVHFLPNPPQREQIARRVSDPGLWRETVCHWLTHGWSPKNVAGMLDLYGRGGPSSCRFCLLAGDSNSERPASRKKPWSNIDQTQVYIDELRREMGLPDPGDHP